MSLTRVYHMQTKHMTKAAQLTSAMLARATRIADISEEQKQRVIKAIENGASGSHASTSNAVSDYTQGFQAELTTPGAGALGVQKENRSANSIDLDEREEAQRREGLNGFVQATYSLDNNLGMQVKDKCNKLMKLRGMQVTIAELDDGLEKDNYRMEDYDVVSGEQHAAHESTAAPANAPCETAAVATAAAVSLQESETSSIRPGSFPPAATAPGNQPSPSLRGRRSSRQRVTDELKTTLCTSLDKTSHMNTPRPRRAPSRPTRSPSHWSTWAETRCWSWTRPMSFACVPRSKPSTSR